MQAGAGAEQAPLWALQQAAAAAAEVAAEPLRQVVVVAAAAVAGRLSAARMPAFAWQQLQHQRG